MKILIDQNISFRLLPYLQSEFPEITHVKNVDLMDSSDYKIFKYAQQNEFLSILTLDEDFNNLQLEHGTPPKIIWLRVGNCSTKVLAGIILSKVEIIKNFLSTNETDCLEIFG